MTVIGFPAKFNNFHNMTNAEAEVFKAVKNEKGKDKNKKKIAFFFF